MRATSLRLAAAFVVSLIALAVAPAARAKERFPSIIRDDPALQLNYDPPCRLCHIQGTTGAGSVSTPFATSMLAHGMTQDEATIVPALTALAADGTDSDGDGKSDIFELQHDMDPNTPADATLSDGDPKYGCSTAGAGHADAFAGAALAALVLAGARRRRRRA
jgi:MYXO-CTERM domain-containing protein